MVTRIITALLIFCYVALAHAAYEPAITFKKYIKTITVHKDGKSEDITEALNRIETQKGVADYAQPYVNTMLGATMQNLFNYEGKYWKHKDISIWPRPFQKPHPQLLMSAATPESAAFAARHKAIMGMTLIADGMGFHVPKGYVYFAMGFSAGVEILNMLARRRKATHPR